METYVLTVWLMWPKVANGHPGEIVRHIVDSLTFCEKLAEYYAKTVTADGVDSLAWSCVQQMGV